MVNEDRTKEVRGQALGKEEKNQKRRIKTEPPTTISEDDDRRTKEVRGLASRKEEGNQKG